MSMTEQSRSALRELQRIDQEIEGARERVAGFEPQLEEVEEPARALESEVETTRGRLREMRVEERRLEVTTQEKQARARKLEERLQQVRNVREESAVSAELEMVRKALESDEQEALSLLDQIRKLELRLEEQESLLEQAEAAVEPRRDELLAEREQARKALDDARAQREVFAGSVADKELRLYESIRGGGRRQAVSTLTADGACGNCFGMVPLQVKNEVRHGAALIRCEACGVILAAPSPDETDEGEAAAGTAPDASDPAASDGAAPADDVVDESSPDEADVPATDA
jgi:predicted  nucleic acid-binding Zn-ribbon protein